MKLAGHKAFQQDWWFNLLIKIASCGAVYLSCWLLCPLLVLLLFGSKLHSVLFCKAWN